MGGPPRLNFSLSHFGGIAIPAMAVSGLVGIIGVLLGLQCGGLDRCFAGPAPSTAAAVQPAAAAPKPAEPRLTPDTVVAVHKAVADPAVAKAHKTDALIGATFAVIRADDAGWLAGARAAAARDVAEVEEGDGAGPPRVAPDLQVAATPVPTPTEANDGETAADAATAVAAVGDAVVPLNRPRPLEVAAFVEDPRTVTPDVRGAAEKKLADVEAAAPEKQPEVVAEPEKKPTKARKVAKAPEPTTEAAPEPVVVLAPGATLTVAGDGVNVRSGPGKSTEKLFALAGGEKVTVSEDNKGWFKITDDEGRVGWVYKTFLTE